MVRDDVSVLHGNHLFQFGGTYQRNWNFHERSDNGGGINFQPVYELGTTSSSGIDMSGLSPGYSGCIGCDQLRSRLRRSAGHRIHRTNCIHAQRKQLSRLNPPLTPAQDVSTIPYYNVYFSDSWRMKPTFTLTYGLGWTLGDASRRATGTAG